MKNHEKFAAFTIKLDRNAHAPRTALYNYDRDARVPFDNWVFWEMVGAWARYGSYQNDNDLDLWGVQGVFAYEIGGATLKSVTAYRDMKSYFTRDGDNTPFVFRQTTNRDKQWQLSQELQLTGKAFGDRVSYVLGGFYFKEKASDIATADLAIGLQSPAAPPPFTQHPAQSQSQPQNPPFTSVYNLLKVAYFYLICTI